MALQKAVQTALLLVMQTALLPAALQLAPLTALQWAVQLALLLVL